MFQKKTKIFAASILGVSILLVGSLVSFTIYLVTKSNAAYDGTSIGYIFGGSYDESYKMLQQLLKDKVVQHALVLPIFLHSQNESSSKGIPVLTPSHLLLVQTSAELIPYVKDTIKKVSKNFYPQKVWTAVFSATTKAIPFLSFELPTAPPSQPTTKDASANATVVSLRVVETAAAATDRSSTLPTAHPSQPATKDASANATVVSLRVVETAAATTITDRSSTLLTAPPSQPATKNASVNATIVSLRVVGTTAAATDRSSTPSTAPPSQPATNDAPVRATTVSPRIVETTDATIDRSSTLPTAPPSQPANRQNGNIFRTKAAINNISSSPYALPALSGYVWLSLDIAYKYGIQKTVEHDKPAVIKVADRTRKGYILTLGPETSPALQIQYVDKNMDGSVLADALMYLQVTPKQVGIQTIQLILTDCAGSVHMIKNIILKVI